MKYIYDIQNHPQKEQIEERVRIIKFFDEFGARATKKAFHKARSTIFLWKKKLKEGNGRLSSLSFLSKEPRNKRKRETSPKVKEFILRYREKHPGVGKEAIFPALKAYSVSLGIKPVSESTIGRIISDLKKERKIPNSLKLSFYAKTNSFKIKTKQKQKKQRRKEYMPEQPGDLVQIDAVTIFAYNLKRYIITAIDIKSRFAFALSYKTLSSLTATDFMVKFQKVAPFKIKRVQTDNGSEFHQYFRDYLKKHDIIHFFNYPRHPEQNCFIERFNGLLQYQYANHNLDELECPEHFNIGLVDYLLWYNTEKPHRNLDKMPPLKYFLKNFIFNTEKSNMLWTRTQT